MISFYFKPAYDANKQLEILNCLIPNHKTELPSHIQNVSNELMEQISLGVGEWKFCCPESINSGSDYRNRGDEIYELAKKLRKKLTRSNQQIQTALYSHCSDVLEMGYKIEGMDINETKLLKMITQVIKLIELGSIKMSDESLVIQGRDLHREKLLILILGAKWNAVTGRDPGKTRNTQFHKLITKVFEIEGLEPPSDKLLKSGLKELYTPKP